MLKKTLLAMAGIALLTTSAHAESCQASHFRPHAGNRMIVAHRTLPMGTALEVCFHGCAIAHVRDRGPFYGHRCLDLGTDTASAVGLIGAGVGTVTYRVVSLGVGDVWHARQRGHHRRGLTGLRPAQVPSLPSVLDPFGLFH